MLLFLGGSLAVYCGVAAILLTLAHRFVMPLRPRIALVLAAAPLLFSGAAVLAGGQDLPLLRLLIGLLSGYLLCRDLWCGELPALMGASAWAFSDCLLLRPPGAAGGWAAPLTLVVLGARRLVRHRERRAAGLLAMAILLLLWPIAAQAVGPSWTIGSTAAGMRFAGAWSLLLPFATAGAFSRGRSRWPFLALAVGSIALQSRIAGAGVMLEWVGIVGALSLAVLAALGAQRLWEGEGGPAFLFGAAGAAIATVRLEAPGGLPAGATIAAMAPMAIAIVLVAALSREARARAGLAALVLLFAAQRAVEVGIEAQRGGAASGIALGGSPAGPASDADARRGRTEAESGPEPGAGVLRE